MKRKQLLLPIFLFFSLSSQYASAQENFSLNSSAEDYTPFETKLPRGESTISMDLQLAMPVSESMVPNLNFVFPGKSSNHALISVNIADPICTGEYSVSAQFYTKKHQFESKYFNHKIPWPETIPVRLEVNRKSDGEYQHKIEVYGETQVLHTGKKLLKMTIDIKGVMEIYNFQIIKEN